MNHYSEFDPYLIKERNEQIRREVQPLRLEGRMWEAHRQALSRLVAFASRSTLSLIPRLGLAER